MSHGKRRPYLRTLLSGIPFFIVAVAAPVIHGHPVKAGYVQTPIER